MANKVNRLFELEDVGVSRDKFDFKEEFGGKLPMSVMEFNKSKELMAYLEESDTPLEKVGYDVTSRTKLSGQKLRYSIYNPDQMEFILKYYTTEGDLILDPFMGRATRSMMSLRNKRRYVGYDIDPQTVILNKQLVERNKFNPDNCKCILGDGTALEEYKDDKDLFDHIITCPPYFDIEKYSGKDGDISFLSDDDFVGKIDQMFGHLYRLIKPSVYDVEIIEDEDKNKRSDIHLVIITVGSKRAGKSGLKDMDYIFQNLAYKHGFVLYDKLITINRSQMATFTFRRNYRKRFLNKNHETTLVFAKFN